MVVALIRQGCWRQLTQTMRTYAQLLGLPANYVLHASMTRQTYQYIADHPAAALRILEDLEAMHDELIARGEYGRIYSLEDTIENLRQAARKYSPMVH